jgi:hypothetical protein
VRLEVRHRRRHTPAATDHPLARVARPAAWPAVERPGPHDDDRLGGLGPGRSPQLVLLVDRGVQPVRLRLNGQTERIPQPAGDDAQVAAVGPQREDGGATTIPLAARIAGRSAPQIEPPISADDHVVLLMPAERKPAQERSPRAQLGAPKNEAFEPPLLGDEQELSLPRETERCSQAPGNDSRPT